MRVLIADNDELLLELLQSYLWDAGHEVEFATNGLACIRTLRTFVPDVAVLDGELLWGGCAGVLAGMREDPHLSAIPVILMSDTQDEFDLETNSNIAAWLRKPYRLKELAQHIAAVHGGERVALPLQSTES